MIPVDSATLFLLRFPLFTPSALFTVAEQRAQHKWTGAGQKRETASALMDC